MLSLCERSCGEDDKSTCRWRQNICKPHIWQSANFLEYVQNFPNSTVKKKKKAIQLENRNKTWTNISMKRIVVPDVRIPKLEERRPPRQCNWQKGEVYYWLEPGPSATSSAVVQVREPRAQAVTKIYRVSTRRWFKQIGYKFAKQFHWS